MVIELHRRTDLLDQPGVQHHDPVGERHRLDLVVGDVDHRRAGHVLVQLGDLDAGRDAQRRVEVRERLVEQEDLRVAHDGAADRDALALAAGKRLRQAIEIGTELQDLGGGADALVDLLLAGAGELHAERHVVVDGHVRVERVGLEHHRDAAARGRHVVHHLAVDLHRAAGDVLQPGDQAEQRRLSAAGRADEDDELAGMDVEVDALDDMHGAKRLGDGVEVDFGHLA